MKRIESPWTHTGVTAEEITTTCGPGKYRVTVPAGTTCHKLDEGSDPWVVADLQFIDDKDSLLYGDADTYGIRIPEDKIADIRSVTPRPRH